MVSCLQSSITILLHLPLVLCVCVCVLPPIFVVSYCLQQDRRGVFMQVAEHVGRVADTLFGARFWARGDKPCVKFVMGDMDWLLRLV